jgi:hypothetical protein
MDYQHGDKLAGQPISMMLAAGPFTLDDDFTYAPLEALIDKAIQERPDVLILVSHPLNSDTTNPPPARTIRRFSTSLSRNRPSHTNTSRDIPNSHLLKTP